MHTTQGIDLSPAVFAMADNGPNKKFYLTDSSEWLLLQELSTRLRQRKASHRALSTVRIDQIEIQHQAHLLEIELRRIFIVQNIPQSLVEEEFELFQATLKDLCSLLNRLALHRSSCSKLEGQKYVHLRALIGVLDSTSGPIDLVNGPNEKLFKLSNEAGDLQNCLHRVTNCNSALSRLLVHPPLESVVRPSRTQRETKAWKESKVRNQAIHVLKTLFKHFKCEMPHEVLLKIIEDQNEDLSLPNLQLMLSLCPDLESWEEVQYGDAELFV